MHCFNLLSTTTALVGFIWTLWNYHQEAASDVFNRNMNALQTYAMSELGDPDIVLDELEAYFDGLRLREEQRYFGSLASKKAMHRRRAEQLKDLAEKTEAADAASLKKADAASLEAWQADVQVRSQGEVLSSASAENAQCEASLSDEAGENVRVKEFVESVGGIGSPETKEKLMQNTAFLHETLERRGEMQNVTRNALLDIWWEGNIAGDPDARQANINRKRLKRLFEMAWMTQQQSPATKHGNILKRYLNDNWSPTDVQRFLEQVLPMDKAQYRAGAEKYRAEDWKERRPQIYNFIADVFEVRESENTDMDLLAARINVERRRSRRTWSQVDSMSFESDGGQSSAGNGAVGGISDTGGGGGSGGSAADKKESQTAEQ